MHSAPLPLSERLEQLVAAAGTLTADTRLDVVLERIVDTSRTVILARYAAIGLLGPDRRTLESFVVSGMAPEVQATMPHRPTGMGILGLVIAEERPIRLTNLASHPASAGFPPGHPPMHSFLGVPVRGRHGVLGHLYLTEKVGAPEFSEEDEHLAVLLAGMAAGAVENARHHEDSARLLGEVQALLRSRERFFAMVNHELRNSIAAVYGWAEMLVRRKDPATVPRAAFEVVEAAEGAVALINDLLDLSRLDEDRLKPVFRDVDCRIILQRAAGKVAPAAEARGSTVALDMTVPLLACRTDAHRVEQILVNLLTNAIRHTPEGTQVAAALRQGERDVEFVVSDTGQGVAPELFEHIFDVYYTNPAEEGRGMGLGLPLSRRLARLLGGELTARNLEAGGAEFTLRIPLTPEIMNSTS